MVEVEASMTGQPDEAAIQEGCLNRSSITADGRLLPKRRDRVIQL